MTEDISQLSVAELLARNGQGAAPNGGGGGRRRRSGRGISVADLTGDIPTVRNGSSSHAASDEDGDGAFEESASTAPAPQPNSGETDYSNFSNYSNNSDYSNFPDYSDFSYSSPTPQADYPDYSGYTAPAEPEPAYSPLSGPISYYDPLAAPETPSLPEPSGYQWSGGSDRLNGHAAPGLEQPRSGRRRKPDPLDADVSLAEIEDPTAARDEGGRRRRFDPEEDTTDEVRPFRGTGRTPGGNDSAMGALDSAGRSRQFDAAPAWSPEPQHAPGFDPLAAALAPPTTQAAPAAPPMSRSARRHAEAQRAAEVERQAPPARPEPQPWQQPEPQWQNDSRRQPEPWQNGARQPEPDWQNGVQQRQPQPQPPQPQSWQGQDQWRDDEPVAPRQDEPRRNGRRAAEPARGAEPGRGALPAWSARRRPAPEPAAHEQGSIPTTAWTSPDQDQQLVSGGTVAGDLLHNALEREDERAERDSRRGGKRRLGGSRRRGHDDHPEPDEHLTDVYSPLDEDDDDYDDDDYDDEPRISMAERFSAVTSKFGARAGSLTAGRKSAPARAAGNRLPTEDENRRQWMILGGQSVGAAIAGMLLFKGFERMWEMLPWVALALAMIVILGLVALVRVLRRTDDIFSTVIAVVVGVFVTLGPLAFLLSTN